MDQGEGFEPVVLVEVTSDIEADMIVGLLTSSGIRSFSQNETHHPLSTYGGQAARYGPLSLYRIYVDPRDKDAAQEHLDASDLEMSGVPNGVEDEEEEYDRDHGDMSRAARVIALLFVLILAGGAIWSALQDGPL